MDSRETRGDRRVRGGSGSSSDRAAGGMCRKLRAGKPASDQRAVRLPSQSCPGAGDRCADPKPRNRKWIFSGTHPEHLFAQCSHYCELVSQPEQMPRVLEIAMQTALSRRGVAVIALPGDIAIHDAVKQQPRLHFPEPKPATCPSDAELAELAKVLNTSKKITILGGAGCAGAHTELIALAGRLKAPVVHAMRGKEFIEYDNPYAVGMTGLLGFSSGYHAMMNCDVLLMIGTDFPYQQFYPKNARIVQLT